MKRATKATTKIKVREYQRERPLRIALDARPLSWPLSGVSRVISSIIENTPTDVSVEYHLFSNRPLHDDFQYLTESCRATLHPAEGLTTRYGGLWFNLTLPQMLRREKFDLFWGSQQVVPPFLPDGMPVVLTYYDLVLYLFPSAMRPLARLQQRALQSYSVRRAERIITISEATRSDLLRQFPGFPAEKSCAGLLGYSPPSKSDARLLPDEGSVELPEQLAALPTKGRFILAVSTLEPRKNYGMLLSAYERYYRASLSARLEPYALVIAGRRGWESPQFFARLEAMQKEFGTIYLLEGLSDYNLEWLYRHAAFFVMPSLYEGFGLPLLEALYYRLPALVSDIPPFHEIAGREATYLPVHEDGSWSDALFQWSNLHRKGRLGRPDFKPTAWSWVGTTRAHLDYFFAVAAE